MTVSIDSTLSKITENGGVVVRGKTPLGENGAMGFLAWFKDSEEISSVCRSTKKLNRQ